MSADTLKSTSITNLDTIVSAGTSPSIANSAGAGARGEVCEIEDYVTPTTGGLVDTTSTYKVLRVNPNVLLKDIKLVADADLDTGGGSAALAFDVGAYYSDSTVDGTPVALQGTAIDDHAFADSFVFGGGTAAAPNSATVTDGPVAGPTKWTALKRQKVLWDALGLSADPGGMIDIVLTVEIAANAAASQPLRVIARIVYP